MVFRAYTTLLSKTDFSETDMVRIVSEMYKGDLVQNISKITVFKKNSLCDGKHECIVNFDITVDDSVGYYELTMCLADSQNSYTKSSGNHFFLKTFPAIEQK